MRAWIAALIVGCGACGSDDGDVVPGAETSVDVGIEASVETREPETEVAVETVAETAAETAAEVSEETVVEVALETIEDAEVTAETAPEVVAETVAETIAETVADVVPETVAEVDVETVDAGSEVTITGPPGQCGDSWDCPGTLFCADSAPGGICNGCSGNDPCPDGLWCNEFGSCSRDCETRADCPQGMRCHPTQTVCVLESCGATDDCEAPYVCDGGMCRRPECGDGSCPGPLVCVDGMCIEPYWAE